MRQDITDWVIHFIHRRNPDTDPLEFCMDLENGDAYDHPDGFDYEGNPLFLTDRYQEEYLGLEADASAFSVLKKILHDGYIRAGWSYRQSRGQLAPTIYGPKAAVCFTEMPLYGLIDYAKTRNAQYAVGGYGIAFQRAELFRAGARPVLYGLSSPHQEAQKGDPYFGIGLRNLHSSVGIGLREQYRYVATRLDQARQIDWMHEREWRWADVDQVNQEPGMHFLLESDHQSFTKIIILVQHQNEVEEIVQHLRSMYDSGSDYFGREYDTNAIKNTFVLPLDQLESFTGDLSKARLDDLKLVSVPRMKNVEVRQETLERVQKALAEAYRLGDAAAQECYDKHTHLDKGNGFGVCGFAHVVTHDGHSEVTQALIKLEVASAIEGEYKIWMSRHKAQEVIVHEAAAAAAAAYLTETLGQNFYATSKLD